MSIAYLWKNREKPRFMTLRFFKVWAKRTLNFHELVGIEYRQFIYRIKGAKVGALTVLVKGQLSFPVKGLALGERCFIGPNVSLVLHEKITIGNRVVINANVQLLTGSHGTKDPAWLLLAKPIVISDYAWIANNAIILPGVTVGKGAVVGAGSVVTKDVPDFAIVAGNPAKIVGSRERELSYSPVDFCSPFEAWLGRQTKLND